ncbi:MAG TPA: UDP-N-acetylglucosamine 2-epimerase (hydrolyzing) [Cytophagales bacterium]|jgi:GDP/UDP-N,N'-diacetylbacillosamine 2-epimerase (hydrolysing)|nr:UDP-N-acetylglucosamine 2-epimerase (hydrolyzing) [Cytophagales bacterium]
MKKRKICVVTGTRAEYGLLYWLMKEIEESDNLELQIIATGTHLSPEFGLTYKEIEKDGFTIHKKVEMVLSADTPSAIAKSTGLSMIGFGDVLADLHSDVMILLGDRYELLAAAFAALVARVPIAHISGGETTEGAFDEAIRHSITKMAWWHFVAADEYQKRVVQLGEDPKRVFNVGGMGVDAIKKARLLSKKRLMKKSGIQFGEKNLLVTYHPVTLEKQTSQSHFQYLLDVLDDLKDVYIIFTMPNSDSDGRIIKQMIDEFVLSHQQRSISFTSMGHLNYLSTLQFVDGVVGNSSSGLAEVPTFKVGTVNIGGRQKGRLKSKSVIDCKPTKRSIKEAIKTLYSKDFQNILSKVDNLYGKGDATEKIMEVLKAAKLPEELKKEFYNI